MYRVYIYMYRWYTHSLRERYTEWVWRKTSSGMGAKKKCTLIDSNMRAVYGYIIVMSKKFEEYIDNVVRMDSEEHHSVTHYDPIVWNLSTIQRLWMFFLIMQLLIEKCSFVRFGRRCFRFLSFESMKIALFCLRYSWNAIWSLQLSYHWFIHFHSTHIFNKQIPPSPQMKSIKTALFDSFSFLPPLVRCTHAHISTLCPGTKKGIHYTLINTASLLNHFMCCCFFRAGGVELIVLLL